MLVVIRGAGDIASGIALRLYRAGIRLVLTDLPNPTAVRRTVCFSEAIRLGRCRWRASPDAWPTAPKRPWS